MTLPARLQKLTQHLSPLQRVVLILQAQREGREPDPAWSRFDDDQQRRVFNRYAGLAYVVNREFGSALTVIEERVDGAELARHYFELFSEAASQMEAQEGIETPVKPAKGWRELESLMPSLLFRGLAAEMKQQALDGLVWRWRELRALETVWDELAGEFGGADPLLPELRARAADTAARLRRVADALGARRRLGEADAAILQAYRDHVDACFRELGLVGPYR